MMVSRYVVELLVGWPLILEHTLFYNDFLYFRSTSLLWLHKFLEQGDLSAKHFVTLFLVLLADYVFSL